MVWIRLMECDDYKHPYTMFGYITMYQIQNSIRAICLAAAAATLWFQCGIESMQKIAKTAYKEVSWMQPFDTLKLNIIKYLKSSTCNPTVDSCSQCSLYDIFIISSVITWKNKHNVNEAHDRNCYQQFYRTTYSHTVHIARAHSKMCVCFVQFSIERVLLLFHINFFIVPIISQR